jgi:aldose 1-epimerase
MSVSIACERFGMLSDGSAVDAVTLRGSRGLRARMMSYGATLIALEAPDRTGQPGNVVLGFHALDDYVRWPRFFGSTVGRYANRIANGRFRLDDVDYQVTVAQPPHALHGGARGFDKAVWKISALDGGACPTVEFAHVSPDGDQGFPGRMDVRVRYTLADDALRIDYTATTDRTTIVNLTNHSYFNLAGPGAGDVLAHELEIAAGRFTPVDATLIPTGELREVAGTPFDFRAAMPIGARIGVDEAQLKLAQGYDHNFVLDAGVPDRPAFAARVREPASGRVMEVWTTEPGIQFYSGNFLDGSAVGIDGRPYRQRDGFCLETQHFPDSPNRPEFPSTVLRPGEVFRSTTALRFPAD